MTTQTRRVSVERGAATLYVNLTVMDCPNCGVIMGIPDDLDARRREDGKNFYCPNGHTMSYGESKAARLERQLKNERETASRERRWRESAERSLAATKGVVTKLRKRTLDGECPFCGQHLRDLARHIGRQHPDESVEDPS